MITQNHPPSPPAAFGPMNGADARLMPDGIPTFRDVDGNIVDSFYTHGSWLRNQENLDNDLKGLLIRCLADQPAHRPTLQELNKYLDKANRIFAWLDDPDDRDWFDQVVNEPPEVRATSVTGSVRRLQFANLHTTGCGKGRPCSLACGCCTLCSSSSASPSSAQQAIFRTERFAHAALDSEGSDTSSTASSPRTPSTAGWATAYCIKVL